MPRPALRRVALSLLALGTACLIAQSAAPGDAVETTSAAWVDPENAKGSITANWANNGFARVSQNGWKLKYTGRSGTNWPYTPQTGTFTYQVSSVSGSDVATLPTTTFTPQGTYKRTSVAFGDASYTTDSSIVDSRNTTHDIWEGDTTSTSGIASSRFCLSMNLTAGTKTNACTGTSPQSAAESYQYLDSITYSIESSLTKTARVNASGGYSTLARCFDDGTPPVAVIADNGASSTIQAAKERTISNYDFSSATTIDSPGADSPSNLSDGWGNWYRYNVQGGTDASFVLLIAQRRNTFVQTSPPYALAEIELNVQVYSSGGSSGSPGWYVDSLNIVLSRSECGLADTTQTAPARRGTYLGDANQNAWPDPIYATAPTGVGNGTLGFAPAAQQASPMMLRAAPAAPTTTVPPATMPSTTATTSPLDTTTSSAPPSPATSTAAASSPTAPVASQTTTSQPIPLAPAPLRPGTPTLMCGGVPVDGTLTDAVVQGTQRPPDCGSGVQVLTLWVNQQTQLDYGWIIYTSPDRAASGWRWAAINQQTGTTVYLR